ncbi:hypothetical protein SPRG_20014 [Saprolegnia parasitica CBS 223.65]|uniref:Golgin subfamily A member 7/ERF4 domain-containing protein n=1 Tax=Saprolegnia parasitica (strain CBS 223.65) TaxID=695850 RepID=A0A067CI05_SAPPC|nr:hypothetical protein SPRG_20014 [Saprolegnia parasitica CBS 223.65]KDO28810.1 hypothetical protein SPRG_20014 [Saprolegnia parasitica CBS 223.65]|eukprot:XP_012200542.1 hypothetical protein SPRG_20014 [Saprolegnia parasitica CBS 223.65]
MSTERFLVDDEDDIVLARLMAVAPMTVDGWPSAYASTYPMALKGIVPSAEFNTCIEAINQAVSDYYPCIPCYSCGYLCCLSTLGLSLLVRQPCTTELEQAVEMVLKRVNKRETFLFRGLVWKLKRPRHTYTSWIEICQVAC